MSGEEGKEGGVEEVEKGKKRRKLEVRNIEEVEKELKRRLLDREDGYEDWDEEGKRARLQEHVNAHPLWADTNGYGRTALMDATLRREEEKVKGLLKDPHVLATINQTNRNGWTALYFSSYNGNLNITRMLTEAGADVNKGGESGITPLMQSCYSGYTSMALHLLEAGADPMKADNDGGTCFHFAAANYNRLDTIKMLLAPYPWPEGWHVAMLCMRRWAFKLSKPGSDEIGFPALLYKQKILKRVGGYLRPKHLGIKKHWVTPEWLANAKTIPKPENVPDQLADLGKYDKTALEIAEVKGHTEIAGAIKEYTTITNQDGEEEEENN